MPYLTFRSDGPVRENTRELCKIDCLVNYTLKSDMSEYQTEL